MSRIGLRGWMEPAEQLCVTDERPPDMALTVDATCRFVGTTAASIVHCENQSAQGRVRISWQNDVAEGQVAVDRLSSALLRVDCECTLLQDHDSDGISWSFELDAHQSEVLTGNYRLVPLDGPLRHSALSPLVLRGTAGRTHLAVMSPDLGMGHDWRITSRRTVAGTMWLDHPLAHPRFTFEGPQFRNWHNRYRFRSGTVLRRQLFVLTGFQPVTVLVPGRYPGRYRALFSITDHADHDSCERLAALWYGQSRDAESGGRSAMDSGFIRLGLPFTKSVFTATPAPDGPGLHNPAFLELCRQGYRAGIEICPHGVHSTEQPAVADLEGLLRPFAEFKPLTWIDHGNRFLSNYGRRGWNRQDQYALFPWLDQLGIKYLWGRLDFGQSLPRSQLDQLSIQHFCGASYLRDLPAHVVRSLRAGRPWAILHGLSSLSFQLVPEPTMRQYFLAQRMVQRVMKADVTAIPSALWQSGKMIAALALPPGMTDLYRHWGHEREEVSRTPIFFPEHDAIDRGAEDRWLFNTIAVHDVAHAYSAAVVDRLIDDYGVHLSHTYLTSVSRAHVSHAIEADGPKHWRLTRAFAENLRGLAERRDAGRLWIASMGEVGEFWRQRHQLRLVPVAPGRWELQGAMYQLPTTILDLQIVAIGSAPACRTSGAALLFERLHDDVQISRLADKLGETIELEVNR